ncbi:MAG: DNA internalization-related competence protein ComEC/Rec2 [Coriobacteriia bacterium]|nr:DNA internalization-related competence protein ComEC/Rec2 [Coriobacteriia bacterium]
MGGRGRSGGRGSRLPLVARRRGAHGGRVRRGGGLGEQRFAVKNISNYAAVRPGLPPLFVCGVGMWVSCALCFGNAWRLEPGACDAAVAAFALASMMLMAQMVRRARQLVLCLLLGVSLGLLGGFAGGGHLLRDQLRVQELADGGAGQVAFVLDQDGAETSSEFSKGFAALGHAEVDGARGPKVRVVVEGAEQVPRFGDRVQGSVRWSRPDDGGDFAQMLWAQGAAGVAYVTVDGGESGVQRGSGPAAVILGLRNAAIDAVEGRFGGDDPAVGVLQALTCGYRANLRDTPAYQAFQTAGLAHLVAVSGAHLAIIASLLTTALRALGLSRQTSIAVQAAFMAAYVVFAGAPISALRAAIMATLSLLSFVPRRQSSSLSALGACIMGCLALDASTATSLSFLLSAGATMGIALFSQLFVTWIRDWFPRLSRSVGDGLAATCAANVLSLGVGAAQFSQLPLVSPLANLVVAPLLSVVCCAGLVGAVAAALLPWTWPVTVGAPLMGARFMVWLVELLAGLPVACVPVQLDFGVAVVASVVLAGALWAWWPRLAGRTAALTCGAAGAIALVVVLVAPQLGGTQIVALDVGQGDAILLRSGGRAVLVDTGNQDDLLRQALARNGVLQLDAVVVSHPDDDHCGSLRALAQVARVRQVCLAADVLECGCGKCADLVKTARDVCPGKDGVVGLGRGSKLTLGSFELEVVWPDVFKDEGGNGDSLCLLARADLDHDGAWDRTALLTGDAESEQLEAMLAEGRVGAIDLLKVGHHGSKASLTEQQALALKPSVALVSVGEGNRYGHPAPVILDALEASGTTVLRTDQQGDLACTLLKEGVRVRTQRAVG